MSVELISFINNLKGNDDDILEKPTDYILGKRLTRFVTAIF